MSLEYGRKSAEEMRAAQRERITQAEAATPAVVVSEKNWAAMIESQKMQINTLGQLLEMQDTLMTAQGLETRMMDFIQILKEDGKNSRDAMQEYRKELTSEVQNTTASMQNLMKDMEKQAGSMSEAFSSAISQEQVRMKHISRRLVWISMLPSLILVVWELVRYIWLQT